MYKSFFRFYLAKLSVFLRLKEFFRAIYILWARSYILKIDYPFIESVWLRRSTVTADFIPFLSDIDLTIVIDEEKLNLHPFPKDLLIKDIQFLSSTHLSNTNLAGGFRQRQFSNWVCLNGKSSLSSLPPVTTEKLAFEVAHEINLLYTQLIKKLAQNDSPLNRHSINKLMGEIRRVQKFWTTQENDILFSPLSNFLIPKPSEEIISKFFIELEIFLKEIKSNLHPTLQAFDYKTLVCGPSEIGSFLALEIHNKKVLVVSDPALIPILAKSYSSFFLVTESFIDLIKGIGVQEQTLLNQLAKVDDYYRAFNLQRLSNDLISAILTDTFNRKLLYYCFKNINEFHKVFHHDNLPDWHQVEVIWKDSILGPSSLELEHYCRLHLEVLRSMR